MITVNLEKAKAISHEKRREARQAEFAPLDVEATVPALAVAAEEKRQGIRDRYAGIQQQIDDAESVDALAQIVGAL